MLDMIAFGFDDNVRELVMKFPPHWRVLAFSVLIAAYLLILINILNSVLARADFLLATSFRKIGLRPPGWQLWLGDFLERLPHRALLLGIVFVAGSAIYSLGYAGQIDRTGPLLAPFFRYWSILIDWLYS